jgi:hypothetical protein
MVNQEEIMNARRWIEFGKMFNNIEAAGIEIELHSNEVNAYYIEGYDESKGLVAGNGDTPFKTPYLAMKDFYFTYFINTENWIEGDVYIPAEDVDAFQKEADALGITMEELGQLRLIASLPLEPEVVEIQEANCCATCIYCGDIFFLGYTLCEKNKKETKSQYVCKKFYPR